MLTRRRLKNVKFLLAAFMFFFFIVLLTQQFSYDEIDVSYQLKQKLRDQLKNSQTSDLNNRDLLKGLKQTDKATLYVSKTIESMKRIVHLDLKGAQPKLAYLTELIKFFKRAGATGVLIEYEDFFPYEEDLEAIRNQNHYTKQEVRERLLVTINSFKINLINRF